ncbi:MAG: hypothetical protein QW397_02430 [Fervidicoccaceae archaeon]
MKEKTSEIVEKALDEYGRALERKKRRGGDLSLIFSLDIDELRGEIKAEIEVDVRERQPSLLAEERIAGLMDEAKKLLEVLSDKLSTGERTEGFGDEKQKPGDIDSQKR